jgi:hypothetical protein
LGRAAVADENLMQKPYQIRELKTPDDIQKLDTLLATLFRGVQDKEFRYLEFEDTGVWPDAEIIGEKTLNIAVNTADNAVRLYTKVSGNLKYLTFT